MSQSTSHHPEDNPQIRERIRHLGYSQRRVFIDEFYFRQATGWKESAAVLDLGGNRTGQRSIFDIKKCPHRTVFANLSVAKRPDVQADAAHIPFKSNAFDGAICSELLEHVPRPLTVVEEVSRVLKPGGTLLITIPFQVWIHGDPHDYGRYTDQFWKENLTALGFVDIQIERQGAFWTVLSDMLRDWVYQRRKDKGFHTRWGIWRFLGPPVALFRRLALRLDRRPAIADNRFFRNYTTGFGIRATNGGEQ